MSARGCCYDNACAELFHTLKVESIHGEDITSREIMWTAVFNYIDAITIGGVVTVSVAVSVRNNLKIRTSLRVVSILRGQAQFVNLGSSLIVVNNVSRKCLAIHAGTLNIIEWQRGGGQL